MAADGLTSTLGTEEILFAVTFFPVSGYIGTMAMGALDIRATSFKNL
jgi:hypothetical protein